MNAQELVKPERSAPSHVIEETYGLTDAEYAVLLQTTCKDAPRSIAGFFMVFCRRRKLDPFSKHVYLWKQVVDGQDKWQIVSGIDGLRTIATRNPLYRGISKPRYTFELDENGQPLLFSKQHSQYGKIAGKRRVVSCEIDIYRAIPGLAARGIEGKEHWITYTTEIRFDEFTKRDREGRIKGNWEEQPEHQLAIRCESHAYRKAFPEDVSGIHHDEEMRDREEMRQASVIVQSTPGTSALTRAEQARIRLQAAPVTVATPDWMTGDEEKPEPVAVEVDRQDGTTLQAEMIEVPQPQQPEPSQPPAEEAKPEPEPAQAEPPKAVIDPKILDDVRGMVPIPDILGLCTFSSSLGLTSAKLRDIVKRAMAEAKSKELTPAIREHIMDTLSKAHQQQAAANG